MTLLAMGWWVWEVTGSSAWVGFIFFCDLFPAIFITPWAATIADRGNRYRVLVIVLSIQVVTGLTLACAVWIGVLTPWMLAVFATIEGALVGFSQPAFFGLINRIVTPRNLASAVGFNSSISQLSYVLGPLIAAIVFTYGLEFAPLAFAANAVGTAVYLLILTRLNLSPAEPSLNNTETVASAIWQGLSVFIQNRMVVASTLAVMAISILQRPLISLLPSLNAELSLLPSAQFSWLVSAFMLGTVAASILHAIRNNAFSRAQLNVAVTGAITTMIVFTILLPSANWITACAMFAILGLLFGGVTTGNIIVLQTQTPEHLRSRVLGNTFMINRGFGALAVLGAGMAAAGFGFMNTFQGLGIIAACLVILSLARLRPTR